MKIETGDEQSRSRMIYIDGNIYRVNILTQSEPTDAELTKIINGNLENAADIVYFEILDGKILVCRNSPKNILKFNQTIEMLREEAITVCPAYLVTLFDGKTTVFLH